MHYSFSHLWQIPIGPANSHHLLNEHFGSYLERIICGCIAYSIYIFIVRKIPSFRARIAATCSHYESSSTISIIIISKISWHRCKPEIINQSRDGCIMLLAVFRSADCILCWNKKKLILPVGITAQFNFLNISASGCIDWPSHMAR